jgi:hypothetical protein
MAFNTKNYVVTWPATNAAALYTGELNVSYLNDPIHLVNGIPITTRTGTLVYNYNLPTSNLRRLTFNSALAGVVFQITGIVHVYPSYQVPAATSIVTENITCTNALTTYTTTNLYSKILSIVPTTMSGTISALSIGYSTGTTVPFYADVWNKANNFSVALTNVATQSLTLQYSVDDVNYFSANITQPPFVVSPTGLVNPITANGIVSLINIPLSSIQIVAASTGTFTATIMQQGASY